MELWRRNFIICAGFLEALLFSGCLFGWPSLLLVLQEEGVYEHLCNNVDVPNHDSAFIASESTSSVGLVMEIDERMTGQHDMTESQLVNNQSQVGSENVTLELYDRNEKDCEGNCSGHYLKTNLNDTFEHIHADVGCDKQRIQMTLIYTFAAVTYGVTAVFIGISLDGLGLFSTRIIGSTLGCLGFAFLAFTSHEHYYFLWVALIMIALGTNQLRFSGFQFADLWPEYRATILTTYSSAYAISTTFFLGVQFLYEWGISMRLICAYCGAVCALTYIPTFFMPRVRIVEDKPLQLKTGVKESHLEQGGVTNLTDMPSVQDKLLSDDKCNDNGQIPTGTNLQMVESPKSQKAQTGCKLTFWDSFWSASGILHIYWHFINLFLVLFYSSTFNIWAAKVTDSVENVSFYVKMSGICCLIAPIFIPVSGILTDKMIRRAEKLSNPVEKLAYTMQAPTFTMAGATVLLASTLACKLFIDETAIYVSLMLIALSRPLVIGSCTSYIRLRFPAEHFNILNGVFTTVISIMCFIQYPIMMWMTSSNEAYFHTHFLLLLLLLCSLVSPGHMMIRRNILAYAKTRV